MKFTMYRNKILWREKRRYLSFDKYIQVLNLYYVNIGNMKSKLKKKKKKRNKRHILCIHTKKQIGRQSSIVVRTQVQCKRVGKDERK